ncbi:hypothetical protein GGQ13_003054 [Salinibacter ruber]|uniref:hypothetical protein n=1 Tax=Salinibacter ruber TaxID=146919 RepID=UPI00216A9679|nr:hypothetical protein [Salinibacter ruber]MCS4139599.1 hypothetical protein [Salinibacter ruber]
MAIKTDVAGQVDVGDTKTVEVSAEDASGNKLPSPSVEVTVTSPSGEEERFGNADMSEAERTYYLDLTFDEAGFWHVRIELTSAGSTEVEQGWVRAREKAAAKLAFFRPGDWHAYLPEGVMQAGPRRLMQLARRAERLIVRRYQETDAHRSDNLILDEYYGRDIRLDGYVEQESSERIDLGKSDPRLVEAMREAAARIAQFYARRPEEAEYVERRDQGERRVDYRDKDLPSSVFAPLRPFDERDSWF